MNIPCMTFKAAAKTAWSLAESGEKCASCASPAAGW